MKRKVLPNRFHLNGHTVKFCPQTQKLEPSHKSPSFSLRLSLDQHVCSMVHRGPCFKLYSRNRLLAILTNLAGSDVKVSSPPPPHLPWWRLTCHSHSNRHANFLPKLCSPWQGNRYGAETFYRSVTLVYGFLEPSVSRYSRYFKPKLISSSVKKSNFTPDFFEHPDYSALQNL